MLIFFSQSQLQQLRREKRHPTSLIFLSGPSAAKVNDQVLISCDIIAVNGSAGYLLEKEIQPFLYVVTDGRFPSQRLVEFKRFVQASRYTFINQEVLSEATPELQQWMLQHCYLLKELYKREKAGPLKKLKYGLFCRLKPSVLMEVPFSRKKRLRGFSKDISVGYCNCKTVAYAAMQIAYSLQYSKIICAGLDLTSGGQRFYDGNSTSVMPSELSRDVQKIINVLAFMRDNIDPPVYTLSTDTAIPYDIIPLIDEHSFFNK